MEPWTEPFPPPPPVKEEFSDVVRDTFSLKESRGFRTASTAAFFTHTLVPPALLLVATLLSVEDDITALLLSALESPVLVARPSFDVGIGSCSDDSFFGAMVIVLWPSPVEAASCLLLPGIVVVRPSFAFRRLWLHGEEGDEGGDDEGEVQDEVSETVDSVEVWSERSFGEDKTTAEEESLDSSCLFLRRSSIRKLLTIILLTSTLRGLASRRRFVSSRRQLPIVVYRNEENKTELSKQIGN
jgi:hypothetical protein